MGQDVLSDGYVKLCIDTSLNFYDGKCRMLIEGQYVVNPLLAVPIVPDKPIHVPSTRDIDAMFTAGSVLAQSLKIAFCICPNNVQIFALPRADAVASVKALYTMTVTGPATSDGQIDIWMGNKQYALDNIVVTSGDTAAAICAAIVAAVPADFPYVAAVAGSTVTFTAKNGGTCGNYLNPIVNYRNFQNYLPTGVTITTVRTTTGATDPAPINYDTALGLCCYNCYALLGSNATWQRGMRDHIRKAWSCDTPQCFGHGYTFNTGTLGQVLATGDNSAEFCRIDWSDTEVNFPWEVVAAMAAKACCNACSSPELSTQGRTYGNLSCIYLPQSCTLARSYDQTQQLQEAGFVTHGPQSQGSGALTTRYIYNDVTNWLYDEEGRPNTTFRDTNSRRLAANTALSLAEKLQEYNGLALYTKNTRVPPGVFGTNKRLMLAGITAWAKDRVGSLFSNFDDLEKDITLKEDFEVAPSCQGVPCKMHLFFRYRPPCRLSHVSVTMQPKMIDNCVR